MSKLMSKYLNILMEIQNGNDYIEKGQTADPN